MTTWLELVEWMGSIVNDPDVGVEDVVGRVIAVAGMQDAAHAEQIKDLEHRLDDLTHYVYQSRD